MVPRLPTSTCRRCLRRADEGGYQSHARIGSDYQDNGEQFYGKSSAFGGGADWGYVFSYGNRTGNDYASGDATKIPASYHNQNVLGHIGFDLTPDSNIEFRYQRLDQTDTEYAGQFFDVRFLKTDALSINYVDESPSALYTRLAVDAWYNETLFAGDTTSPSKIEFNVINRVERAIEQALSLPPGNSVDFVGFTKGGVVASGVRSVLTYGEEDWRQLFIGTDLHHLKQRIEERYDVQVQTDPDSSFGFQTNLPHATIYDPGIFAELMLPLSSYWTSTLGARLDWTHTDARQSEIRALSNLDPSQLSQNDVLYSFYLLNDVGLSRYWDLRFGFGQGQRAPTMTERYADGVFLGVIQSGFNRFIGTPTVDKERAWQVDASLETERDFWRGRLAGYHSWIVDYITYTSLDVDTPEGARLLRTINTDLATLSGFEASAELDLMPRWTVFGSMFLVDGRDQEIDRPLFNIPPLEGAQAFACTTPTSPDRGRWS